MPHIEIPYAPRVWARAFHESPKRFAALVLHRRAGKTTAVINHHLRAALDDSWERRRLTTIRPDLTGAELDELIKPPGGRHYGHCLPLHSQAKLVVWDKLKYYANVVPGVRINESELLVRLPNGNKVQLFGADNPDAMRGPAFSGLSFDEYSQMHENIFTEILSKSLADHLGYAIFLGTIKGRDHLYHTWEGFKDDPDNYALWQDIDRSLATENGVTIKVLETAMADDRKLVAKGLMSQDEFDQEWYLSTDAAIKGAWYINEMAAMLKAGRITRVPHDASLPVDTDWDIGMVDAGAVVFSQTLRSGEIRIIDYYEAEGEALPHYIQVLKSKSYVYRYHRPPHDAAVKDFGTGKNLMETAQGLGFKFEWPSPNPGLLAGIDAVRMILSRCWIDEEKCKRLIECLRNYRKKFNVATQSFTATPVHNEFSHGADAFRYLAVSSKPSEEARKRSGGGPPQSFAWS